MVERQNIHETMTTVDLDKVVPAPRRQAPEIMIDDTDPDEVEIEIVDDTPEADQGRPRRAEGIEPDIPEDDEIATYGEKVQKRLKTLKFDYHEERRQKEETQRHRDEAVRIAKQLLDENQRLKTMYKSGETVLIEQASGRVAAEMDAARRAYKEAYELGDTEKLIAAQETMGRLQVELDKVKSYRPVEFPKEEAPQQQRPAATKLDPKAVEWQQKNPWFGSNRTMTALAVAQHEDLVRSGVAPTHADYYPKIDAEMRRRFPDFFGADMDDRPQRTQTRQTNVVAPARRSVSQPRTKITMTSSQVSLAKRLGLTSEQYAAQLLKEQGNG